MYNQAKPECDYKTFKDLFYNSKEATAVYSGLINDNEFFQILANRSGSEKSADELKTIYLKNKGTIYLSTLNIIKYLKNNNDTVCLLSNLKEIDYHYLDSVLDLSLFDKLFLSYRMHLAKPDKKIYEAVIKELGTNDFYFFDDSPINIESAKRLGINAYNVTGDNITEPIKKILLKNNKY